MPLGTTPEPQGLGNPPIDELMKHADSKYLTDESRAFTDAYAMTFPHEDRSLLLAYAMMEGNARYFATDTMQAKLALVCEGIRDAYGYWWSDEPFLWEQYLPEE